MVQFKKKYGTDLPDEELTAQAYYEDFQERMSAGMLRAESLDQVISMAEAEEQERQKPDPPKQFGIHLDSKLTLQTRRRYTGTGPKNTEELRAKYVVMSNMWRLAQLRQPGRSLLADDVPANPEAAAGQRGFRSQERALRKVPHGALLGTLYVTGV